MFKQSRVRNYDIPTAIDVLTTGSYQRLPTSIKQTYIGEEKPSRAEIAAALEKLDDVIRMRLLCDELVPPGMKYTVAKGKAKFVVPKEFEVQGPDCLLSKSRNVEKSCSIGANRSSSTFCLDRSH